MTRKMKCLHFNYLDNCIYEQCPYYDPREWSFIEGDISNPAKENGIHIVMPSHCTLSWFAYIANKD